jgi:copper chaperone CopZ
VRVLALACIWFLLSAVSACADKPPAPPDAREIRLSVPDMECPLCGRDVTIALRRLPGVLDVKTDDVNHTATVRFRSSILDVKRIVVTLRQAGFDSSPLK